ncbi:hypothetical protein BJY01DRAFT_242283 [Aspergillus pseudoustus]|uniref:DUF7600 domain-containing protein n=1 Tax=Aspergillus pseudoustus TaxID=1810923 RepID=A0ABR4L049_9EURO
MGFAKPITADGRQEWTEAYRRLHHALRDGSASMGLLNRRRIWDRAGVISDLFGLWMPAGATLHGSTIRAADVLSGDQRAASEIAAGQKITTHSLAASDGRLLEGNRVLCEKAIVIPLDEYAITRILVSSFTLNKYQYITGLCFGLCHYVTGTLKEVSQGYLLATRNEVFVAPSDRVIGIQMAACARGIQAIKVLLGEDATGDRPEWEGVQDHGQAPVAVRYLDFKGEQQRVRPQISVSQLLGNRGNG